MSDHPADFLVQIIKGRPQGVTGLQIVDLGLFDSVGPLPMDPPGETIDVTDRATLEDLGSINRAVERDLLSFKTGDVTLSFINDDRFFDGLFAEAVFTPATIWSLRIIRRGKVQFWGMLYGIGSIRFDPHELMVEVTAYGLTKLLDVTDAAIVRRAFAHLNVVTANAGSATLVLNGPSTTPGIVTGDVLHLTDHLHSEDAIVKQVLNGTDLALEAALANTYSAGTPVILSTPFYRYKTIEFLVGQLFKAAFIPMAEIRLSRSLFDRAAPTPVNLQGLDLTADARRGMAEAVDASGGLNRWIASIATVDSFSQAEPDAAWVLEGLTDKGPYDWSPYYPQGGAAPAFLLYEPVAGATFEGALGERFATYWGAADYYSATKRVWGANIGTFPLQLKERTTVDGVTYTASTGVNVPADSGTNYFPILSLDYDPIRNITHMSWGVDSSSGSNRHFRYRDHGGASWVDCKQGDDAANTGYYGARYVADKDYTLVLRKTGSHVGPDFEICAFRGNVRLWKRPFPSCLIASDLAGNPYFYPTRTARFLNGSIYMVLVSDGAVKLLRSDDDFQTFEIKTLVPATTKTIAMACRVRDTYRIFSYRGAIPRGYFVAAPFYAGVIEYADFEGLSVAEALKKLSVLCNAVYYVDDDLQGHFVARDLYDPSNVVDISDRFLERSDTPMWEEIAQFVKLSGNSIEVTSGDAGFAAEGIELESSLLPNEAFAQALADCYHRFYSVQRAFLDGTLIDEDGTIFRPLDRVVIDGLLYYVNESDTSLADDEIPASFVQHRVPEAA